MDYIAPSSWPPPRDWPPPCDDWRPPEFWKPRPGFPISPDGSGYLVPAAPGAATGATVEDGESLKCAVATRMVAMWSKAVMACAHSYYQAAMKAAWMDWAINKGEDWSPSERELSRTLDQVWVRGYQLVTAAYQMERWRQVYEGKDQREETDALRRLRNSIEHLDAARFSEFHAYKGPGKRDARDIEYLPGQEFFLGFHASFTDSVFGLLDLADITERARPYLYINEPDEPDVDWSEYVDVHGDGGEDEDEDEE